MYKGGVRVYVAVQYLSYDIGLLLLVGVGELYTLIDEGGQCSLTAAERERARLENRKRISV